MRFYSARETSHPGVFAVRQTDRQSGESRELEAYIVCVELQGGRDRYYIKAGRVATDRDLQRFCDHFPFPRSQMRSRMWRPWSRPGRSASTRRIEPLHARPSLETKGDK
jgi:hypothetical protein